MKQILIIGAGASGMIAAIWAARKGAKVTILEGMEKPGKKLLTTGNGRCNLTNVTGDDIAFYRGADAAFIKEVLQQFTVEDTLAFFHQIGLLTRNRNGYVYPYTDQAQTVVELLLQELERLNVKIKCQERIQEIKKKDGKWLAATNSWTYEGDALILSTGSKAAPVTGSDGSGYGFLDSLGHKIQTPMQALVPLRAHSEEFKGLAGIRCQASLTLLVDKQCIDVQAGELQWTERGISGIVVFQLSRYAVKARKAGQDVVVLVDFMPEYSLGELHQMLIERIQNNPLRSPEKLLTGVQHKKMLSFLLKKAGCEKVKQSDALKEHHLKTICQFLKACPVEIERSEGFDMAQVCQGGADAGEVSSQTLESKLHTGLYLTGELLDVDGICGGYNLQWAWSSGYVAGCASTKEINK